MAPPHQRSSTSPTRSSPSASLLRRKQVHLSSTPVLVFLVALFRASLCSVLPSPPSRIARVALFVCLCLRVTLLSVYTHTTYPRSWLPVVHGYPRRRPTRPLTGKLTWGPGETPRTYVTCKGERCVAPPDTDLQYQSRCSTGFSQTSAVAAMDYDVGQHRCSQDTAWCGGGSYVSLGGCATVDAAHRPNVANPSGR